MIDIKWADFALVLGVSLSAAVVITLSYSGFIRLKSVAQGGGGATPRSGAMAGAIACLAVGVLAVLFGLWLIVPQLHPWFK